MAEQQGAWASDVQETPLRKRIMFISSYSFSWASIPFQIKGIKEALDDNYVVNYEFMDTKNTRYSEGYKEFYELIKYKLNTREKYDGIIVGDDAALMFAQKYREELFPNIPIVFEGIDNVENGLEAAKNPLITGVVEKVDYEENIKLAQRIFPQAKRIVFILDNMENGIGIAKQLQKSAKSFAKYEVKYLNSSEYNREDWIKQLSGLTKDDIVFCISMGQSKSGMIYSESERYALIREYTHVPLLRLTQSGVGEGVLGGYIVDHEGCGKLAGNMMADILNAKPKPAVRLSTPAMYYFDYRNMEKYGIREEQVVGPNEGRVTFINKPDSFVRKNAPQLVGGLFFLILIIVSYSLRKSRNAEKKMAGLLESAQKASNAKTAFLSRMSHDMRTPMNGILGLAELSADENDVEILHKNIAQLKNSGQYLLSLINDTLDFQRIESNKMVLNRKLVYVQDFFTPLMEILAHRAAEHNIEFKVVNNIDLNVYTYMDPVRLKQVAVNIVSNAIKFTPAGGIITITLEALGCNSNIMHTRISCSDTGIGMSKEFIEKRLFKAFEQESNDIATQYTGSGLGLSIVHSLVEMMGGSIQVASTQGEGTTFTLYFDFPLIDTVIAQQELEHSQHVQSNYAEKLKNKRLLVVEDHPLNAKIAQKLLEKAGCIVLWVDNGLKAVETFTQSEPGTYAAILMDVRMPVMNGIEAARAIRQLERNDAKTIPILAMTANTFVTDVNECLAAGMNDHIAKPLEAEKMYRTIAKFM